MDVILRCVEHVNAERFVWCALPTSLGTVGVLGKFELSESAASELTDVLSKEIMRAQSLFVRQQNSNVITCDFRWWSKTSDVVHHCCRSTCQERFNFQRDEVHCSNFQRHIVVAQGSVSSCSAVRSVVQDRTTWRMLAIERNQEMRSCCCR